MIAKFNMNANHLEINNSNNNEIAAENLKENKQVKQVGFQIATSINNDDSTNLLNSLSSSSSSAVIIPQSIHKHQHQYLISDVETPVTSVGEFSKGDNNQEDDKATS